MACACFQLSNTRDESLIHPYRAISDLKENTNGISMELQDHGYLLVRVFNRNTDYIIGIRIYNVHQPSYLIQKPSSIIKTVENNKNENILMLT